MGGPMSRPYALLRLGAGACILCLVVAGNAAWAFGTVSSSVPILDQDKEHERITRRAFVCGGGQSGNACFQARSLDELAGKSGTFGAIGAPDNPARNLMNESSAHCDNGDFLDIAGYPNTREGAMRALQGCREWMNRYLNAAVDDARALVKDGAIDDAQIPTIVSCTFLGQRGRAKCNVLENLGLALHAAQDFYSHTNWTDQADARAIGSSNPPGLNRNTPSPWLNLRRNEAFPPGLISGCFRGIPETSNCNDGGGVRVKHATLNKDRGTIDPTIGQARTDRGRVQDNFRRAVEAAIADSRDKWATLQERLIAKYGQRDGGLMICALTRDDPKDSCR